MAFRRLPFLMVALLFVDFIDEFASGMPTVGVPGIQADFELRYSTAAFLVFTGPLFVAWLLEPPLFLFADRRPKKLFVCGGLLAMGVLDVVVGISGPFYVVAGALLLSGVASGAGVSLSQATLMDLHPENREQLMTRWVFMGALGDLAAPALFWLLAVFALGWRQAFVISGVVILAYAMLLARQDFPRPSSQPEDASEMGTREALRAAFRDRRLLLWLFGSWLCSLMDEILVAFGALHMRDNLGADAETRSLILMCFMAGALVALPVLERLLARFEPLVLLRAAAVGTALAYVGWLLASDAVSSGVWMFATGVFSVCLYPLAKAQAYRALPGRSGMLNAIRHVFTPLDVAMPFVLGLVADAFGLVAALVVLLVQPIGLFLIGSSRLARAPAS
jgi:predicted MFS family arabinose efflux permease